MTHDDFLDAGTADRLLDGEVAPADAPPGYTPVASVLDAARAGLVPPAPDLGTLARVAHTSSPAAAAEVSPRRSPVFAKILTLKAAAVAGVIILGAGTAAAATGVLPAPVQRAAHDAFSAVGLDVPDDVEEPEATEDESTEDEDSGVSTSTTSPTTLPVIAPPLDPPSPPASSDDFEDSDDDSDESDDDADSDEGSVDSDDDADSDDDSDDSDDDAEDDDPDDSDEADEGDDADDSDEADEGDD